MLDSFLEGLGSLRSPGALLRAAAASLASWLVEGSMYYVIGEAFHLDVGFHVYLIILAASNLALSIFASPGGVGPFEVATREVLVFFNVAGAKASAYALALHALLLGPVIVAGFALLWLTQLSLRDLIGSPAKSKAAMEPTLSPPSSPSAGAGPGTVATTGQGAE
jgi:uncharacterized membrane protein YbhN (UPF0104 family)